MSLSDEDREALHRMLGCCVDCPTNHGYDLSQLDEVAAWVEARIARHVTAALEAAADEIDEMVASSKSPVAGEDWHGFVIGYACSRTDAARIVRNLATPPQAHPTTQETR